MERNTMRQIREILRQKWVLKRSHREVARSVGVSVGAVGHTTLRARAIGLDWTAVESLTETELEARLYQRAPRSDDRAEPDMAWVARERLRAGVTLALLHMEYLEKNPGGIGYTSFCNRVVQWKKRRGLVMRQHHIGGDKCFVDYAGKKPHIVDGLTGEVIEVELFVGALGASNRTYAEATMTQRSADFIGSHIRMYEYFGGVPKATVCDQLKTGVTHSCRYEPETQRIYEEMAVYYQTTILPARPAHPRDKGKVEVAVQIAERWVLARIRDELFNSLAQLNARIRELIDDMNRRVMRRYKKSRDELFIAFDKPALMALPIERFEYAEFKKARINIDYHVAFDGHFYSAPYRLVHEEVWLRATSETVEILHKHERIASHVRSHVTGAFTTVPEHMASAHRAHAEWTPSRIVSWAETIGPHTKTLVDEILSSRRHPEMGYRSCLGILRLGQRFGAQRLEAACLRASTARATSYRHVQNILNRGLDKQPLLRPSQATPSLSIHDNIRGPQYYH